MHIYIFLSFLLVEIRGQSFFTPPLPNAATSMPASQNCVDKTTCSAYSKTYCTGMYQAWAKQNCPAFCGICTAAPQPATSCADKLNNCGSYGKNVCSNPKFTGWVNDNCKYFCRQCSAQALAFADSHTTTSTLPPTTTVSPEKCLDVLDCKLYGKTSCSGKYEQWARANCMNYCGFCIGVPTPPPACVDTIPNCSSYSQSTCSQSSYEKWAEQYCRKYCGLCAGQNSGSQLVPALPGRRSLKGILRK